MGAETIGEPGIMCLKWSGTTRGLHALTLTPLNGVHVSLHEGQDTAANSTVSSNTASMG